MEELGNKVTTTRKKISALMLISRGVWVTNCLIGFACFTCHRYDLAAAAGYACLMSLLIAACARRATRYLYSVERVISSH
jgi:hypothetical protein